jgi:hypothetical protein
MKLRTLLFGKPLRSDAEAEEQLGPVQGVPVLGLDALDSASYGPEAALTILVVIGRPHLSRLSRSAQPSSACC